MIEEGINQGIQITEHKPMNISDIDQIGKIIERQKQPRPLTTSAKNPRIEMTDKRKRKLWGNLHRQLGDELYKAKKHGYALEKDIIGEAARFVREYDRADTLEMDLMDGRVRDIVRMLIAKRREFHGKV